MQHKQQNGALTDEPSIKDISDILDQGGCITNFEQIIARIPEYEPEREEASPKLESLQDAPMDDIYLIQASAVVPERVEWLWRYRLPRGKIVTIDGDPGLGKSTALLDIAARISVGGDFPDGERLAIPGCVVILSAEDGVSDTIVPRLRAAGANLKQVFILDGVFDNDSGVKRPVALPDDMDRLRAVIEHTNAVYVVVDPLMAFLGGTVNSHKDQDVRRVLHMLKEVAEETKAAIVVCRHLTKSAGTNPLYRGGGSIGIIGAARVGMIVAAEPGSEQLSAGSEGQSPRRIIAVAKSNVGRIPSALAYHIETDREYDCSRIVWEGTTEHRADELVAPPPQEENDNEAEELLRELLEEGPIPSRQVDQAMRANSISPRQMKKAKKKLGIISTHNNRPGDAQVWMFDYQYRTDRKKNASLDMSNPEMNEAFPMDNSVEPDGEWESGVV